MAPMTLLSLLLVGSRPTVQQQSTPLPFVSPMFGDNMVLQREKADEIWGWTTPGTLVKVSIDGKTGQATAGADGKWLAKVGPIPVGGPYELDIDGPQKASFTNVMVGDVWICSGQSNMEFGVGNLLDPNATTSQANYPNIRLYFVPHASVPMPIPVNSASWMVCTPDNLAKDGDWGGFSAVAYFFGRQLHEDLKVPIGLVHTSWGGTVAEAWTPATPLIKNLPEFTADLKRVQASANSMTGSLPEMWKAWYQANDMGTKATPAWSDSTADDSGWKTMTVPGYFQDAGYPEFKNQQSVVWFRKEVDLTADQAAQAGTLNMTVDDNDATWVNGKSVGATDGVANHRAYAIPAGDLKEGANVIAVRVTDTYNPGGIIGQAGTVNLTLADGSVVDLGGTWKIALGAAVTASDAFPTSYAEDPNHPTLLYNGMIYPLEPFTIKGAIWYQGESNSDRPYQYRKLLPTMIQSWRDAFGQGAFPFIIVQLAGFGQPPANPGDDGWAELREAQFLTTKALPYVGIATAFDIGNPNDIHPKNKMEVGRRLAMVAEKMAYGKDVIASGPVFRSATVDGSSMVLKFNHAEGGLAAIGGGDLKGFAIAGDDHKWVWANAKIEGFTVRVSAPGVDHPVAVRYGWASYLDSNLGNGKGWPAFPFRTDDWKEPNQK